MLTVTCDDDATTVTTTHGAAMPTNSDGVAMLTAACDDIAPITYSLSG